MPIDATQPYDDQNIFAKILRGEIPSKRVYEDEFAIGGRGEFLISHEGILLKYIPLTVSKTAGGPVGSRVQKL